MGAGAASPGRSLAIPAALLAAVAASCAASGCGRDAANCDVALTCPGYADAGAKVPVDPACAGEPMLRDAGPASDCGLFASPTAPAGGDGSKASPYATLHDAVAKAATTGLPVFACGKTFAENVEVPAGVILYGALDCDDGWVWKGTQRTLVAPPAGASAGGSEIAVKLAPGTGTLIEDVDVVAPDAVASGVSSVALLADGSTAQLTRCNLVAGNGASGATGAAGSAAGADGASGIDGSDICNGGATNPGSVTPAQTCAGGGTTMGGKGGDGVAATVTQSGKSSTDGSPASPSNPTAGKGGADAAVGVSCVAGGAGANGPRGEPRRRRGRERDRFDLRVGVHRRPGSRRDGWGAWSGRRRRRRRPGSRGDLRQHDVGARRRERRLRRQRGLRRPARERRPARRRQHRPRQPHREPHARPAST